MTATAIHEISYYTDWVGAFPWTGWICTCGSGGTIDNEITARMDAAIHLATVQHPTTRDAAWITGLFDTVGMSDVTATDDLDGIVLHAAETILASIDGVLATHANTEWLDSQALLVAEVPR